MAKKAAISHMNQTERVAGTIFFIVYLLVLPLLANKLFGIVEVLLDTKISDSLANIIYYYVLFAIVLLLFHSFLAHTTSRFLGGVSRAMTTFCMGLLVFYGANELFYRVANVLFNSRTNLNDMTIAASINAAPRLTALIIVFLAPFVEEVLFRGLVFGCLKEKSRVAAYVTDFPSDALLGAKGVICTPHLGASTPESEENCAVMAAAQTRDFLESGIIRNSVNLPAVDVAPVSKPRLFCIHENVPNVLGSITSAVAGFGLNISDLVNRSRGSIAVSVVDLDEAPSEKREALTQAVKNIAGMKRVRLLGV